MAMAFFLAGYTVVWALVFVYTALIANKQRKLERELSVLEELAQRR